MVGCHLGQAHIECWIGSVQTRRMVKDETQKSPRFWWLYLGGVGFQGSMSPGDARSRRDDSIGLPFEPEFLLTDSKIGTLGMFVFLPLLTSNFSILDRSFSQIYWQRSVFLFWNSTWLACQVSRWNDQLKAQADSFGCRSYLHLPTSNLGEFVWQTFRLEW